MANSDVEVFGNRFENNKTVNLIFGSYVEETDDPDSRKHPARIHIHDNSFGPGGYEPDDSEFGNVLRDVLGTPVPNIVWDGVMTVGQYFTFGLPRAERHAVHPNDHGAQAPYANADFMGWFGLPWLHKVTRDAGEHDADLAPLPPARVVFRGQDVTGVSF